MAGQFIQIISKDEKCTYQNGDSRIFYRRLPASEVTRIEKKWTTKKGRNSRTGEPIVETDLEQFNNDLLDYLIIDWENVKDDKGKDIPCTKEVKLALPSEVRRELIDLAGAKAPMHDEEEDEKKTSKSTHVS
jgi:hypothetical protein